MKRDLGIAAAGIIIAGALAYTLAAVRPDRPLTPSQPFSAKTTGTAEAKKGRVIMHVNGEPIDEYELNAFLQNSPEQLQIYFATDEGRRLVAQEFVKLKVLEQEGKKRGYDQDPDVTARLTADRLNVLAGFTLRRMVGDPTEEQLRAEFEKAKPQMQSNGLSHVLIAYEGGQIPPREGKPLPLQQAAAKAAQVVQLAKQGIDFRQLAQRASDDVESARQGGFLGPVSEGSLPPEINAVVMKLKPGEVSNPVRSPFGIHVFKVSAAQPQPFEQVRNALAAQVQRKRAEEEMSRLEKAAQVEFDPKFFPAPKAKS